jgi:ADP-heptose:LPS heptosyltransferase
MWNKVVQNDIDIHLDKLNKKKLKKKKKKIQIFQTLQFEAFINLFKFFYKILVTFIPHKIGFFEWKRFCSLFF